MKPMAEFFFSQNTVLSDESWFRYSQTRSELFIMHSEQEYHESMILVSSKNQLLNLGEFLFMRSSYSFETNRK